MKDARVDFSETETNWLGLKFGRYNSKFIESEALKRSIAEGQYDVVRVKVSCEEEFASLKLFQLNYPFHFNAGIRRYQVDCLEAPLPPFTAPEINFELFLGQNASVLEHIISDSLGDSPLGYYRTPGLYGRITKEMEVKCLFEYYQHFSNHNQYPNSYLWFMKLKEEYIGFISLTTYKEKDMVDSTLAGLLKKYQSQGLFPNILRHIRKFCREQNIKYFCCGARLENLHSQWAFEKDYMKCVGVDYVFHVLPFLGAK